MGSFLSNAKREYIRRKQYDKIRVILLLALFVITILTFYYVNVLAPRIKMAQEDRQAFENIPKLLVGKDITKYKQGEMGDEFYSLYSYDENVAGRIRISIGNHAIMLVVTYWEGDISFGGPLPGKGYNGFKEYIKNQGVDFYDDYAGDSSNDIKYAYLHCTKDSINSFYFSGLGDTVDSIKYTELINIFTGLFEICEREI